MSIRFLSPSRRNWIFAVDEMMNFEGDGVRAEDGIISFARNVKDNNGKETFDTVDECIKWYRDFKGKDMDTKNKVLSFAMTKAAGDPTDSDWELMKKWIPKNSQFKKTDYRIFDDYLANNFPDRDSERFPLKVLKRFNKTIVGKQKLKRHEWSSSGFGRYFKSTLLKLTKDELMEMTDGRLPASTVKLLDKVLELENSFYWMKSTFFVPKHRAEEILDIESGITNSSIGFMGLRREDFKDGDGETVLWQEFQLRDDTEALEGSIVGVEAQHQAGVKKLKNETNDDPNENIDENKLPDDAFDVTVGEGVKPYANEHACRLTNPDQYDRFARKNCGRRHEGKCIDHIYGVKNNKAELQALRYKKDIWTAQSARAHCKEEGGSFEPAKAEAPEKKNSANKRKGADNMEKLTIKRLDIELEIDEENLAESLGKASEAIETKVTETVESAEKEAEETKKSLEDVMSVFGEEATKDDIQTIKEGHDELFADQVERTIKMGLLAKVLKDDKANETRESYKTYNIKELKEREKEFTDIYNEKHPPDSDLHDPDAGDVDQKKPPARIYRSKY